MSIASRARQSRPVSGSPIDSVLTQYAEEAPFLWLLRDAAVRAPHYSLPDLARLDERLDAQLDGLVVGGEAGWQKCVEELNWAEPGEVFAASAVASISDDVSRIQPVLEAARQVPELQRAIIAALGFLPHKKVMARIAQLGNAKSPDLRFIGLSASAIQRIDPGKILSESMESDHTPLRSRACRAVGELGRRDLLPALRKTLNDDDVLVRFWAAWSLGLLGDRGVADVLRELGGVEFPRQLFALDLALRLTDLQQANAWRQNLAADPGQLRLAIIGAGTIGDPAAVPWLIDTMMDAKLARVAGESFTTITGADLATLHLDTPSPEELETGPNDNPEDEIIAMDPDEDLPWPDPPKVKAWWSSNAGRFTSGQRYLLGLPIAPDSLQQVLRTGCQRHRAAAAIEIMLADPKEHSPLFEVRAHARMQKRLLGN